MHVIWDFDGPIAYSLPSYARTIKRICEEGARAFPNAGIHYPWTSLSALRRDISADFVRLYEQCGFTMDAHRGFIRRVWAHTHNGVRLPLVPGIQRVLTSLHAGGVHMSLATSRERAVTQRSLGSLVDLFYFATYGDNMPPKPHPGVLQTTLEKGGMDPTDCVYVCDTRADVAMMPRIRENLGCAPEPIVVTYGWAAASQFATSKVQLVHSVPELEALLLVRTKQS